MKLKSILAALPLTTILFVALLLAVAVVSPAQVTFTAYPVPTTNNLAEGINVGPDGNLWFIEGVGNTIWKMTTAGVITGTFPVPTANSGAQHLIRGSDGNSWFQEYFGQKIGRITPTGVITEFPIPAGGFPFSIAAGPDGNLWFTQRFANALGRITPAGVITEFPVPTSGQLFGITAGPDGNLWYTGGLTADRIGRMTPTGVATEFPVASGSYPYVITTGPDGNLWFTENHANKIGRITPAGVITEFSLPTANSSPYGIAAGPDGNLWFTEGQSDNASGGLYSPNKIGRITPAGVITEFFISTGSGAPAWITAGPDGNLWFIDANQIVKATLLSTPPGTLTIYPATGGNTGNVTVQIFGSGFQIGATAKLTGLGACPSILQLRGSQRNRTGT